MAPPESAKVVVIGAGVHGLSTSWHLATELEARGLGSGADVVVLDKTGVGAGPSGLACGVIRNNYFQPAMRELMAHSVQVWESDPEAFHYHPVGYLQVAPEVMHEDVATIHEQQRAIGYTSDLIEGEDECRVYMESIFHDWQAKNVSVVLHEKKGGYAESMPSMLGLRAKGEALGVRLIAPVTVAGFEFDGGAISKVVTDRGDFACEQVVVAAGPWVRDVWHMLDLPGTVTVRGRDGRDHERPMWTYWCLVEGTLGVDPSYLLDNDGNLPPVVHLDTDAPLLDDTDGSLVTDELWGIYYKPDFNFGGVQGGAMPWVVDQPADEVAVDPYGPESTEFVVGGGLRAHVDLGARALPQAVRGQARALPPSADRRDRRVHPRQLPRVRHVPRERARHRGLEPRLQDDRRGRARGEGGAGGAAGAVRAVPVLPVRRGEAPPREPLALPLELAA